MTFECVEWLPRLMRNGRLALLALIAAVCGSCAPAEATGTYMSREIDNAQLFHIIVSPDGSLSGSAILVRVSSAGKLSTDQYALTGAKDGKALQITLKSGLFGFGDLPLIGEESGGGIRVSVASGQEGVATGFLKRATMREFEAAIAELKKVADYRAAELARAEAIKTRTRDIERATKAFGDTERAAQEFLRQRTASITYRTELASRYAKVEAEMELLANNPPRNIRDPIDHRNAMIDLRYALMDINYTAQDIDYESDQKLSNHIALARSLKGMLGDFTGKCDISSTKGGADGVAASVQNNWKSACKRLWAILPEVSRALDDTDGVARQFEQVVEGSRQRRAAFLN